PRTDIFLIPFPRTRRRGRRRRREPYSNPIRAEIRLPPPCEGRHARSCAPPSIGRPPYRRARRVSRFPHWTSSSTPLVLQVGMQTLGERLVLAMEATPAWIHPHSSSASRFTAGASGFFILSQTGERPEREVESLRFDTIPSNPTLPALAKTLRPSPPTSPFYP